MATAVTAKKDEVHGMNLIEQRKKAQTRKNILSYIVLSIMSIFFFLPLVITVSTTLKLEKHVADGYFIPQVVIKPFWFNVFGKKDMEITMEVKNTKGHIDKIDLNYDGAFYSAGMDIQTGMPLFARWYLNSIFVGIVIVLTQLITCSLAAYAFARIKWPGRDKVFLAYLGTMMVPGQVTMIPVFIMFRNLGIINTYAAVILPGAFSAYGTFMLRQYFLGIPSALEEAAIIDGATKFTVLREVIVPLSKTALSTLAIFVFLYAWNDFMWPMIVLHDDSIKTLPIGLMSFMDAYGSKWHLLMGGALISLLPVIIVFTIGQKYITKGIMMSGLK